MTNSNLQNSDSAHSICCYYSCSIKIVLLKLFTFLINTADKEIRNIYQYFFYSPSIVLLINQQTNKHTTIEF